MTQIYKVSDQILKQLPIYFQPWWLDIVCGEGYWKHITLYNGKEAVGIFALFEKRAFGIKYISMPHFTPYMGPFFFYPEGLKVSSKLSLEEKVLEKAIEMLAEYAMIEFNLLPQITNIFPFHKKGFRNRVRYTYIISEKKGIEGYLKNMNQKLKKEIARNKTELKAIEDASELFKLLDQHEDNKNIGNAESKAIRIKIDKVLSAQSKRRVYGAFEKDILIGGVYIVEDTETNYLMFTAQNKLFSKSGIIAKLIDHAIKITIKEGKDFDFEGSMIPGVERFFRRFGGELKPYHVIVREKSIFFRIFKALKNRS